MSLMITESLFPAYSGNEQLHALFQECIFNVYTCCARGMHSFAFLKCIRPRRDRKNDCCTVPLQITKIAKFLNWKESWRT